jgi:hypothetical protein
MSSGKLAFCLSVVIAGLVPAISIIRHSVAFLSEMAGTSPAMTSGETFWLRKRCFGCP